MMIDARKQEDSTRSSHHPPSSDSHEQRLAWQCSARSSALTLGFGNLKHQDRSSRQGNFESIRAPRAGSAASRIWPVIPRPPPLVTLGAPPIYFEGRAGRRIQIQRWAAGMSRGREWSFAVR